MQPRKENRHENETKVNSITHCESKTDSTSTGGTKMYVTTWAPHQVCRLTKDRIGLLFSEMWTWSYSVSWMEYIIKPLFLKKTPKTHTHTHTFPPRLILRLCLSVTLLLSCWLLTFNYSRQERMINHSLLWVNRRWDFYSFNERYIGNIDNCRPWDALWTLLKTGTRADSVWKRIGDIYHSVGSVRHKEHNANSHIGLVKKTEI